MAIFGGKRDISMFRHINRELMWDIVTQQCSIFKLLHHKTKFNIYGEASGEKFYTQPILLNCLIERKDQTFNETEFGTDLNWNHKFNFLNDDLAKSQVLVEIGDIIMYEEKYYEVFNKVENQLFTGKNPRYDQEPQPLEYSPTNINGIGLKDFGWNISTLVEAHYVPASKLGIENIKLTPPPMSTDQLFIYYVGAVENIPTNENEISNLETKSSRALKPSLELTTGTEFSTFVILIPEEKSILSIYDQGNMMYNLTSYYELVNENFIINSKTYKMYVMSNVSSYINSTIHKINII